MATDPTDTAPPTEQPDPPALAASVVGAVRTEKPWAANTKPTPEQYGAWLKACTDEERVEVAAYMWQAIDEANDCFVRGHKVLAEEYPRLCRQVAELTAQRDLARDAAVALEQELAQQREDIAADFQRMAGNRAPHLSAEENRRASDWNQHAADRIRYPERFSGVAAAVLGLGLQPETSEQ